MQYFRCVFWKIHGFCLDVDLLGYITKVAIVTAVKWNWRQIWELKEQGRYKAKLMHKNFKQLNHKFLTICFIKTKTNEYYWNVSFLTEVLTAEVLKMYFFFMHLYSSDPPYFRGNCFIIFTTAIVWQLQWLVT